MTVNPRSWFFVFMSDTRPSNPIRIGDALTRRYRFYNPLPDTDPPEADTNSPMDLSGIAVTFRLKNNGVLSIFAEGSGVTVDDNDGIVDIALTATQTSDFTEENIAESCIGFDYGSGTIVSKAQLKERITTREAV